MSKGYGLGVLDSMQGRMKTRVSHAAVGRVGQVKRRPVESTRLAKLARQHDGEDDGVSSLTTGH